MILVHSDDDCQRKFIEFHCEFFSRKITEFGIFFNRLQFSKEMQSI